MAVAPQISYAARAAFHEPEAMRRSGYFGEGEMDDGVGHSNAPLAWHLLRDAIERAEGRLPPSGVECYRVS